MIIFDKYHKGLYKMRPDDDDPKCWVSLSSLTHHNFAKVVVNFSDSEDEAPVDALLETAKIISASAEMYSLLLSLNSNSELPKDAKEHVKRLLNYISGFDKFTDFEQYYIRKNRVQNPFTELRKDSNGFYVSKTIRALEEAYDEGRAQSNANNNHLQLA